MSATIKPAQPVRLVSPPRQLSPPGLAGLLRRPAARWARVALVLVNLAVPAAFLLSYSRHGVGFGLYRIDLAAYRMGGQSWLHGEGLYGRAPVSRGLPLPFTYPPIAAALLAPLAVMAMTPAGTVLTLGSIALVALVLWVFLRRLDRPGARPVEAAQEHPQHQGDQRDAAQGEHGAGRRHRHDRERGEQRRRDGRVGERQRQPPAHRRPAVQPFPVQPRLPAHAVGGQVDAVQAEAHPVPRVRQQERRGHGQVDQHERDSGPARGRAAQQPGKARRGQLTGRRH